MKRIVVIAVFISALSVSAQKNESAPVINPLSFGVVLDDPEMKNVKSLERCHLL